MSTPDSWRGWFGEWRAHRATRAAAERRRSAAQNQFNRLQRETRRDLRAMRRRGETAAIVARARFAELGVRVIMTAFRGRHRRG